MIRVLSFDPASFRNLGWAVVDLNDNLEVHDFEAGTLVTDKTDEPWQVLWQVFQFVDNKFAEKKPNVVVVEQTSVFRGGFVTGQVSNCMGVILCCCQKYRSSNSLELQFVYPTSVKKGVAGKGKASKKEIMNSVKQALNSIKGEFKLDSEHAYDAVANILFYAKKTKETKWTEE